MEYQSELGKLYNTHQKDRKNPCEVESNGVAAIVEFKIKTKETLPFEVGVSMDIDEKGSSYKAELFKWLKEKHGIVTTEYVYERGHERYIKVVGFV